MRDSGSQRVAAANDKSERREAAKKGNEKLLAEFGLEHYVPRMWGVNGIGSVLGAALAIILAITFGFSYSMILGAILYFFIVILFSVGFLFSERFSL